MPRDTEALAGMARELITELEEERGGEAPRPSGLVVALPASMHAQAASWAMILQYANEDGRALDQGDRARLEAFLWMVAQLECTPLEAVAPRSAATMADTAQDHSEETHPSARPTSCSE